VPDFLNLDIRNPSSSGGISTDLALHAARMGGLERVEAAGRGVEPFPFRWCCVHALEFTMALEGAD